MVERLVCYGRPSWPYRLDKKTVSMELAGWLAGQLHRDCLFIESVRPARSTVMLHSDCAIVAIVSIVSLRSEVEHGDFNESIHTARA